MSIRIDKSRCIGCGSCAQVCPGNLLSLEGRGKSRKSSIFAVEECWGCCSCVKECPRQAIALFLGADIGGDGTSVTFSREGRVGVWHVRRPDGSNLTVRVDGSDANKY